MIRYNPLSASFKGIECPSSISQDTSSNSLLVSAADRAICELEDELRLFDRLNPSFRFLVLILILESFSSIVFSVSVNRLVDRDEELEVRKWFIFLALAARFIRFTLLVLFLVVLDLCSISSIPRLLLLLSFLVGLESVRLNFLRLPVP